MVDNISKFTQYDVIRTFFLLKDSMSRFKAVSELEIGEGTLRTILDLLKKKGFIVSSKQGHRFSEKGVKAYAKITRAITPPVQARLAKFFNEYYNVAVLIRKYEPESKKSYKLRDIAIKNGAEAALLFDFRNGLKLMDAGYKGSFEDLEKQFSMKNGDVLVVTASKTRRWAEIATLAVAIELNPGLMKQLI